MILIRFNQLDEICIHVVHTYIYIIVKISLEMGTLASSSWFMHELVVGLEYISAQKLEMGGYRKPPSGPLIITNY